VVTLYKGVEEGQGSQILFILFHTGLSGGQRLPVSLLGLGISGAISYILVGFEHFWVVKL
jgi:hypothetical protein